MTRQNNNRTSNNTSKSVEITPERFHYGALLSDIKGRIRQAQQPVAQLQSPDDKPLIKVPQLVAQIPRSHHLPLMEKAQPLPENLKSSLPSIEQTEAEPQRENPEAKR